MNVSMDGMRNRMISSYNSLTKKLNEERDEESGDISIDPLYIENEMNNLRNCIVTLACMYDSNGSFSEIEEFEIEDFITE
jgi:hypothetical protein